MHVYIITRGIKDSVDKFIRELSSKYLPFKFRKSPEKELENFMLQTAVRPIQLWEVAFPVEHKDLMYSTIFPGGNGGKTQHPKHQKWISLIRRILGIKEISEYKNIGTMPICLEATEIIGVGEKEDYWIKKDGTHVDKWEEGCHEGI